jgi:hypothetical protein
MARMAWAAEGEIERIKQEVSILSLAIIRSGIIQGKKSVKISKFS